MSLYKLDMCPQGINSLGMTRVLHLHSLVAVFASFEDAKNFVDMKERQQKQSKAAQK